LIFGRQLAVNRGRIHSMDEVNEMARIIAGEAA
jgi:5-methylthioribose kinase